MARVRRAMAAGRGAMVWDPAAETGDPSMWLWWFTHTIFAATGHSRSAWLAGMVVTALTMVPMLAKSSMSFPMYSLSPRTSISSKGSR